MPTPTPAPLAKPEPAAKGGRISYNAMMAYLEQKYGFNSQDFFNRHDYYYVWCAKHGEKKYPKEVSEQQRIFREFNEAPDGAAIEPEYANFWHWMLDLQRGDSGVFKSMTAMSLNIPKTLANYDNENRARQEAENAKMQAGLAIALALIPDNLRQIAIQQYKPKEAGLRPFVKTILGYIQAEFGDVVKLKFKD